MEKNTNHIRNAIYPEWQQIIYWLGGHCGKVLLFFSPLIPIVSATIDHCSRKHVCDWTALLRIWAAFANPCVSVGVGIDFGYQIGSFLSRAVINIWFKSMAWSEHCRAAQWSFTRPRGVGSPVPLSVNACHHVWRFHHHSWCIPPRGAKT